MTHAVTGRARARIGLLGNPGDLYGGTVLAATILHRSDFDKSEDN